MTEREETNVTQGKCLCVDVGGSAIKYGIIGPDLKLTDKGDIPTPHGGVEPYLAALEKLYKSVEGQVQGIAMSVPGVIDSENGICISGGNLSFIHNYNLAGEMTKRCKVPVTVMNDAKSAAMAEAKWGALSDCRDGIVIVLGTGIGGALIKDGNVHFGKSFAAGEFSFLLLGEDMDERGDTWAGRAGNPRLRRLVANAKGIKDPDSINGFDVFRWAEEGDPYVLMALDQFTRNIAHMIVNLQVIYDPDRFAIGGGISRQPLLLQYIQKNLNYFYSQFSWPGQNADVTTCKFFNDANLIGAYSYFLSRFGKESQG
ncbi:MAG: ROK family protein [Hungatella sp.]|nr:ROK family protein [Hungatella sp.]